MYPPPLHVSSSTVLYFTFSTSNETSPVRKRNLTSYNAGSQYRLTHVDTTHIRAMLPHHSNLFNISFITTNVIATVLGGAF